MKHADYYTRYKALDDLEREELKAAVLAQGGKYVFPEDNMPIILGSFKHCDTADYYVTKVVIDEDGWMDIYGYPTEYWDDDEDVICYIEFSHISFITDMIPETENVKNVSLLPKAQTVVACGEDLCRAVNNGIEAVKEYAKDEEESYVEGYLRIRNWNTENEAKAYCQGLADCEGWNEIQRLSENDPEDIEIINILKPLYDNDEERDI